MLHLREMFFGNELASVAPDEPLCVIGDIHGRYDLLDALLDRVGTAARLVFVGDYLDRGPHSARVIDRLIGLTTQGRATCLMGNHEAMFLGFIDAPERGGGWLRAGGTETLASYGVGGVSEWADLDGRRAAHGALLKALPLEHLAFLFSLQSGFRSGNLLVSHAGADPHAPVDRQSWDALVWGHEDFGSKRRDDGLWVAHGHRITREPLADKGQISVDTGAWQSGRLTAAMIEPGMVRFLGT